MKLFKFMVIIFMITFVILTAYDLPPVQRYIKKQIRESKLSMLIPQLSIHGVES